MNKKRLFAFGCSFTKFFWPTWADIVAEDLGIEYYNCAIPGLGNTGIQSEIVLKDFEYKFDHNDMIMIMWSAWHREDRYIGGEWKTGGSIFNNPYYNKEFIKNYWDYSNDIIKNVVAISLTGRAYRNLICYQGHIMPPEISWGTLDHDQDIDNKIFQSLYSQLPVFDAYGKHDTYSFDSHPTVKSHLDFVTDKIYPALSTALKPSTIDKYTQIHQDIEDIDNDTKINDKMMAVIDYFKHQQIHQ